MGSPITPAFANIFMNWVIEQTRNFEIQPEIFYRYVDDIFTMYFQTKKTFPNSLPIST